jgi:hypothetical protein
MLAADTNDDGGTLPWQFAGGEIKRVGLAREAKAMLVRE